MKTQTKQPEYSTPEVEAKIRKYNIMSKGLIGLGVIGLVSTLYGISAPIFSKSDMPKIAQTHQNNEENLRELRYKRKNIETFALNLEPPYQTKEIKEAKEFFDRTYDQSVQKLTNAIESAENKILKIKEDNEFKQYQQNKTAREKRENYLVWGGTFNFCSWRFRTFIPIPKKDRFKI